MEEQITDKFIKSSVVWFYIKIWKSYKHTYKQNNFPLFFTFNIFFIYLCMHFANIFKCILYK